MFLYHWNFSFRSAGAEAAPDHLFVKTGYEQQKVLVDEIRYLEATGNYVTFGLGDRNILSRSTFSEAIALLPAERFVRIHRSFVVSLNRIDKVERHQVTVGEKKIPVGDAYRQHLAGILRQD